MREYGVVYSRFWLDQDMVKASDQARLLALYLLTGPHTQMSGCFRMPLEYVSADLGWSRETVSEGFKELFGNGFAYRCPSTGWVLLKNWLRFNPVQNPNCGKTIARQLADIPERFAFFPILLDILKQNANRLPDGFVDGLCNRFANRMPNQDQDQEQNQEKEEESPSYEGVSNEACASSDPCSSAGAMLDEFVRRNRGAWSRKVEPENGGSGGGQEAAGGSAPEEEQATEGTPGDGAGKSAQLKRREKNREEAEIVSRLAELWNAMALAPAMGKGDLPTVMLDRIRPGTTRFKTALARWREMPDLAEWSAFFNRVGWSKFLRGENDRGWRADFDWVLKPGNFTRILEGRYDERGEGQAQATGMVRKELEEFWDLYGADGVRDAARERGISAEVVDAFLREKEKS